jgi:ribose 5-phosphate isomerase B
LIEALKAVDPELVKGCMIPRFLDCFYAGCKDDELKAFVDEVVSTL